MNLGDINFQDILLRGNYITQEELNRAKEYAQSHHTTVLEHLLSQKILTKELLGQAIAESFGIAYADVTKNPPPPQLILEIPQEIAEQYLVVIIRETGNTMVVATANPSSRELAKTMYKLFPGKQISVAYAFPEDIEQLFIHYRQPLEARFVQIVKSQKKVAPEILEQIFQEALIYRASDIHFEPHEDDVVTRFRVDGVLQQVGKIPRLYYENILNRIKVQAKLKIDEHFSAQDGSIRFLEHNTPLDIRVSIVPTVNGEKVVMRLLAEYVKNLSLSDLGLSLQGYNEILQSAKRPFGMMLVTGPTGSGKTTTLYALLKKFENSSINITTIEDPVEYRIPTMNQIQVNAATNLNFADGLRSILRQDPDIILVGEIRDKETSEVAVNAALTGHLLFSTFHANDACTVIPRLLDMGVEPYLVASTLELIVAQRLARRICENCRFSVTTNKREIVDKFPAAAQYFPGLSATLYKGKGCPACNFTGYRGRIGIFEYIQVSKDLQDLITKNPSAQTIWQLVRQKGFRTMFEDGLEKVNNGTTTLEELMRVAAPTS